MVFFCIRLAIQHRSFISPAGISGYFKTYLLHVKSAMVSVYVTLLKNLSQKQRPKKIPSTLWSKQTYIVIHQNVCLCIHYATAELIVCAF